MSEIDQTSTIFESGRRSVVKTGMILTQSGWAWIQYCLGLLIVSYEITHSVEKFSQATTDHVDQTAFVLTSAHCCWVFRCRDDMHDCCRAIYRQLWI